MPKAYCTIVGFSSGIKAKEKAALTEKLEALKHDRSFTGNAPGGPSRWSTKRSSEWQPVKPEYVWKYPMTILPEGAFGTARPSSDGGLIKSRASAPWSR